MHKGTENLPEQQREKILAQGMNLGRVILALLQVALPLRENSCI